MTKYSPTVLAVMEDLMFMVRIQEAAKNAGLSTVVVKTKADAMRKAAELPALIILDLNYSTSEPLELIKALKDDETMRAIHLLAFVSHVQIDLKAAAVTAGCDTVLARSAFVQNLPDLLRRAVSSL